MKCLIYLTLLPLYFYGLILSHYEGRCESFFQCNHSALHNVWRALYPSKGSKANVDVQASAGIGKSLWTVQRAISGIGRLSPLEYKKIQLAFVKNVWKKKTCLAAIRWLLWVCKQEIQITHIFWYTGLEQQIINKAIFCNNEEWILKYKILSNTPPTH